MAAAAAAVAMDSTATAAEAKDAKDAAGAAAPEPDAGKEEPSADDELAEAKEGVAISSEDLEDETCGFCKFMKAGPCGQIFAAWEKCVDTSRDAGKDFVEECLKPTQMLKECMEKFQDYYADMNDGGGGDRDEEEGGDKKAAADKESAPESKD